MTCIICCREEICFAAAWKLDKSYSDLVTVSLGLHHLTFHNFELGNTEIII